MRLFLILVLMFNFSSSFAQLTPPGLGANSRINGWFAVGFNQKLDSAGRFTSMSYLGIDGQSVMNRYNVFDRLGIFVVNEEVKYRMKNNWNTSLAVSYRQQNVFEDNPTSVLPELSHFKREFRVYGRIGKTWNLSWKPSVTLRQEWRKFYTPEFQDWKISSAFRTRLKFQSEINLTRSKRLKAILGAEFLFATEFLESKKEWGNFNYSESRLSAFLSFSSKNKAVSYNLGVMDDILESDHRLKEIPYVSFALVFNNIFRFHAKEHRRSQEMSLIGSRGGSERNIDDEVL